MIEWGRALGGRASKLSRKDAHTRGKLQHPGYAIRRLLRPLGITQEHPNGQWSLLMV